MRGAVLNSDELLENKRPIDPDDRGNGSIVHITAIFGFMLAGLVIEDISMPATRASSRTATRATTAASV